MKRRTFAAALTICLLSMVLLGACATGGKGSGKKEPAVTLDRIRSQTFTDLASDSPYYDTACYMTYYQIMQTQDGAFQPYTMVTRGQAAEAVFRISGQKAPKEQSRFTDVAQGSQYAQAVAWCDQAGILADFSGKKFEPQAFLTRGELAAMLYHAAEHFGYPTQVTGDLAGYVDADQVNTEKAMTWIVQSRLFSSFVAQDRLLPNVAVSRLQVAQTLVKLRAFGQEDKLASQISAALPERASSAARDKHQAIQIIINSIARKYGAQGLQVAVVEDGAVTDTYAYGWATKGTDPMTADHKIRIASISKVAVGLAAMLLREDGIIDLDQDISTYWDCTVKNPQYPNIPITIRSMLTHTSSLIDAGEDASREYNDVRSKLQAGGYSGAMPGSISDWNYNNFAFSVLGMTLELAADQTLDNVLKEKLYGPMDMDTAFASGDILDSDKLVTLYTSSGEVARSISEHMELQSQTTPGADGRFFAGGMTTSVTDLAKLAALLAGDGKYEGVQLLEPETVELMETCLDTAVSGGSYQALPMRYLPELYGREGIYFHTGSAYGVFNCFCYDPATGDGVVVLTSGASGAQDEYGIYKVCAEINAYIYDVIQ